MAKKKTAKKIVRKATRAVSATKTSLLAARTRTLEAKLAGSVPRAQLQSAMAKYRAAMTRFNSKRYQVRMLQAKVCDLKCRIEELEQELAAAKTPST